MGRRLTSPKIRLTTTPANRSSGPRLAASWEMRAVRRRTALFLSEQVAGERLQIRFRARAVMLDHLGRRDRSELQRALEPEPVRLADQEAGREQIARPGRVDDFRHRLGGGGPPPPPPGPPRAPFSAGGDPPLHPSPVRGGP